MKKTLILFLCICSYAYSMQKPHEQPDLTSKIEQLLTLVPRSQPERLDTLAARIAFKYLAQQEHPKEYLGELPTEVFQKYINMPVDEAGRTALYYATTEDQFKELEEFGANYEITDKINENSLLNYALKYGKPALVPIINRLAAQYPNRIYTSFLRNLEKIGYYCTGSLSELIQSNLVQSIFLKSDFGSPQQMHRNTAFYLTEPEEVTAFASTGFTINQQDIYGNTPTIFALKCLMPETACAFARAGADIAITDEMGRNALMYAVIFGYNRYIMHFLSSFTMAQNCYGNSVLDLAALYNSAALGLLLQEYFEKGHNIVHDEDLTVQHLTCALKRAARNNASAFEILLSAGATINGTYRREKAGGFSDRSSTSLMVAARYNQNPSAIQWLLDHGADPNLAKRSKTALSLAVLRKNNTVLETLIRAGAAINHVCPNNRQLGPLIMYGSILHLAVKYNYDAIAHLLNGYGQEININVRDEMGDTPLMALVGEADDRNYTPWFITLIEKGVALDIRNTAGCMIVHRIVERFIEELVRCEEERKLLPSIECLQILIHKQVDCNVQNNEGNTPLGHLFRETKINLAFDCKAMIALLDLLISGGADITLRNNKGNTLLHGVIKLGYPKLVNYFLSKKLDRTVINNKGHTPLQHAQGKLDKAHRKIKKYADPSNPSHVSYRELPEILAKKYKKIVKLLSID